MAAIRYAGVIPVQAFGSPNADRAKKGKTSLKTFTVELPRAADVPTIRKELGLSQEQFAQFMGVSVSTLRNWEQERSNLFNLSRLIKVDLIVRNDDEFQRHEFAPRQRHELGGSCAWVIGKEDLILSKLVWAAPTESAFQLRDVRKLLASGADEAYRRQWSLRLGVDELLRKCMDAGYGF